MGLSSLWIHQRYTSRVWLNDSWQMGCDIAACVASDLPTVKCQFYLSCDIDSGQMGYHGRISSKLFCSGRGLRIGFRVVREGRDPSIDRFGRLLRRVKPARNSWLGTRQKRPTTS